MARNDRVGTSERFQPLRERQFRYYFLGGLTSNIGTWIQNVSAGVLMMDLTGSARWVGYLSAATFAPLFIFGMWGGVLSDRVDRRVIVYVTSGLSMVLAVVLASLTAIDSVNRWTLLIVALLLGGSYSILKPTWSAILPLIVPRNKLTSATAFNVLQYNLGRVFGAAIATGILITAGPAVAFGINALTFAGPILAAARLRIGSLGQNRKAGGESTLEAFKEGVRFILRSPVMRLFILMLFLVNVMSEAISTLAPAIAQSGLRIDVTYAGTIVTAVSLGMTAALVLHERLFSSWSTQRAIVVGFSLQAFGGIGVAWAASLASALVASVPIGVGTALVVPRLSAGMQQRSPDEYLGRVSSAFAVTHLGLRPLVSVLGGILAEEVGVAAALTILAVVPIVGVVLGNSRRLRL